MVNPDLLLHRPKSTSVEVQLQRWRVPTLAWGSTKSGPITVFHDIHEHTWGSEGKCHSAVRHSLLLSSSSDVTPESLFCFTVSEVESLFWVHSCILGPWVYNYANKLPKLWREMGPEVVKVNTDRGDVCCSSPAITSAIVGKISFFLPCRPPQWNSVHLPWL